MSMKPVLLIRPSGNGSDAAALAALGIDSVVDPYLRTGPVADDAAALALLDALEAADASTVLAVTSTTPVPVLLDRLGERLRVVVANAVAAGLVGAAPGERTADDLRGLGVSRVMVPPEATAARMVTMLSALPPGRLLHPCGTLALPTLPDGLRAAGWQVEQLVVYETVPVAVVPASAELVGRGEVAAVVLRSPSAARALAGLVTPHPDVVVVCAGRTTADAARTAGLRVDAVTSGPSPADVAAAVAAHVTGK